MAKRENKAPKKSEHVDDGQLEKMHVEVPVEVPSARVDARPEVEESEENSSKEVVSELSEAEKFTARENKLKEAAKLRAEADRAREIRDLQNHRKFNKFPKGEK